MAKYNLELETTTHIKGMQVGDCQPDTGGGGRWENAYQLNGRGYIIMYHGDNLYIFDESKRLPETVIKPRNGFVAFRIFIEDMDYCRMINDRAASIIVTSNPESIPSDAVELVYSYDSFTLVAWEILILLG